MPNDLKKQIYEKMLKGLNGAVGNGLRDRYVPKPEPVAAPVEEVAAEAPAWGLTPDMLPDLEAALAAGPKSAPAPKTPEEKLAETQRLIAEENKPGQNDTAVLERRRQRKLAERREETDME